MVCWSATFRSCIPLKSRRLTAESLLSLQWKRVWSDAKVGSARRRLRAMSTLSSRSSPHWNGGLETA